MKLLQSRLKGVLSRRDSPAEEGVSVPPGPLMRRLRMALVVVAVLVVTFAVAFQVALAQLQRAIETSLGPRATVGSVHATWRGIEVRDLRVRADRGSTPAWPVDDELRATRVFVVPDVGSLFSPGWRVHSVRIEDAYVSVVRQRDERLVVLPALLRRASSDPAPTDSADPPMAVDISTLELSNASVDFFDASVRRIPHRMQLTQLQVRLEALALPQLDRAVQLDLQGVFDGRQRDGRIEIRGEVTPATRDAQLQARFSGVDLTSLQPYLLRVNEGGVRSGTLDLSLQARVVKNQLEAPGKLVLTDLALAPGGGPMATFAGVPRQAVLAAMSRDGRIELNFVLKGRLDDPAFSINDNLALRVAVGLAETLGVSLGGVVQGLGDVVKGLFGR